MWPTLHLLLLLLGLTFGQRSNETLDDASKKLVSDVRVFCNSDAMVLSVRTQLANFNGMIYPKGLAKNSSCKTSYVQADGTVQYRLPLHACNTMSTDVADGMEFFNTVVVQPHRKLVTNQGKGFHVRCRYRTESKTLKSDFDVGSEDQADGRKGQLAGLSGLGTTPLVATASMPGSSMRIYRGEPVSGRVAESVQIGDPLTLVIGIDDQDIYGMAIHKCHVRDGLGWTEQLLIDNDGCPVEKEIMGEFEYSKSKTTALVRFQAHKFPYTDSVYYTCNVRLCIKHAGGCDDVPPKCDERRSTARSGRRTKRQTIEIDESRGQLYDVNRKELEVRVYSGLYVNEADDLDLDQHVDLDQDTRRVSSLSRICFAQRDFAVALAVLGLALMLAVALALLCVVSRGRSRKNYSESSIYSSSGPYSTSS